jgi:hypothetical protein
MTVIDLLMGHMRLSGAECQCGMTFSPNRRGYCEHLAAVLDAAGWLRQAPIRIQQ